MPNSSQPSTAHWAMRRRQHRARRRQLLDAAFAALQRHYTRAQIVELCLLVGQYEGLATTIAALGITEPDAGSDVAALRTTVVKDGSGHYIVNAFANYELARNTTLSLGVNNLFNTLAYTEAEGQNNLGNNPLYIARALDGRSVKATLKYSF